MWEKTCYIFSRRDIFGSDGKKRFLDNVTRSWNKRIFELKLGTHTFLGKSAQRHGCANVSLRSLGCPWCIYTLRRKFSIHSLVDLTYHRQVTFPAVAGFVLFFFFFFFFTSSVKMYFKRLSDICYAEKTRYEFLERNFRGWKVDSDRNFELSIFIVRMVRFIYCFENISFFTIKRATSTILFYFITNVKLLFCHRLCCRDFVIVVSS